MPVSPVTAGGTSVVEPPPTTAPVDTSGLFATTLQQAVVASVASLPSDPAALPTISLGHMITVAADSATGASTSIADAWATGEAPVPGAAAGTAAATTNTTTASTTTGAAGVTPDGAPVTGVIGHDAPPELEQYGNGRIPRELLTEIGIGGHRLWTPAAESFMAMREAAATEGIDIGVTDSYRTYDQQVDLARRKGLWKDGGYAAVPGTSQHGWGKAVDVDVDPAGLAWLRANAGRFGFVEDTPREPWHWAFHGIAG
jgi:D-alanyl-D-alanine dipeptidase